MRGIQAIITDLQNFQFGGAADEQLSNLADELEEHPESATAIRAVLELFERYPDEDFGMPGPLAHVIERFYGAGYETELELSLRRKPTTLTLWFGNRIVNAKDSCSEHFIDLLSEVAHRANVAENIRTTAQQFVGLHRP
ncbi:hypothetical protein Pan110_33370 [Gimesia panareensis]|nr:hypothetical protein Pan110_33370 [Gimesia panareensis]